jgi:hypothetical protein
MAQHDITSRSREAIHLLDFRRLFGTARKNETKTDAIDIECIFAYGLSYFPTPTMAKASDAGCQQLKCGLEQGEHPIPARNRSLV